MPVQDVTVEWSEQLSPPVTVAKLRIPRQDISGDDNLAKTVQAVFRLDSLRTGVCTGGGLDRCLCLLACRPIPTAPGEAIDHIGGSTRPPQEVG